VTTANFRVTAPSARIARLVADAAERTRKEAAFAWLGKELPRRPEPCPVAVTIVHQGFGGATTFDFSGGKVSADMRVEGVLDRILADVVPHEVTHTVLADHFRAPLPRWADEGISLLSESKEEQARYTSLNRQTLNEGNGVQIRVLFAASEYPRNVIGFLAQSYSVTSFLVDRKDRPTFVKFVEDGMKDGWEAAAKAHYGFASLNDLERAWIEALKATARSAPAASNAGDGLPVLALAQVAERGDIIVCLPSYQYQPATWYTPKPQQATLVKDGKPETHTYYEPVSTFQARGGGFKPHTVARNSVRALGPDGKAIDQQKMIDSLKGKPKPVIVCTDPAGIDPMFAEMLKPGTLILVLPAPKNDDRQMFEFWLGLFR
jgi:hypothetical protein